MLSNNPKLSIVHSALHEELAQKIDVSYLSFSIPNNMSLKRALEVLLYFGLPIGSIVFVKQIIDEYLEGDTFYIVTQEPINSQDLPTVTVCWEKKRIEKRFSMELKMLGSIEENIILIL